METSLSKPIIQVRIITWLSRENSLLTSFMDGVTMTNAKVLCLSHGFLAGYWLLRSVRMGYPAMGICMIWFIFAILLCCKVK